MKAREPVSWPAPAPASAAGRTTIVPCPAISSPARAGPMMNAAWNIVRFSESAPGRSSGGTSRGMSACRAGLSNAEAAARSAFRAYRVSTVSRPAKVSAASAADSRAMHDWAANITFLRSARSATTPPHSENAMMGMTRVSPTMPRARGDRVSRYTCQWRATICIWEPVMDTSWAAHSRRKSRCRRAWYGRWVIVSWGALAARPPDPPRGYAGVNPASPRGCCLHAEYAEPRLRDGGVERSGDPEGQDGARVTGRDHAVVPQPRARVVRAAFLLVLGECRRLESVDLRRAHALALPLELLLLDLGQHRRRLLAPHHRDPRVRPHPELARLEGAPAHPIVAGPEAAPDDDGELRHLRVGHRVHHLGPILRDAALLVLLAHDEARDVLQEHQRHLAQAAHLDEMRGLQGALGEEHAVVGQDPHGMAHEVGEAGDESRAVEGLELAEAAAVHDPRDHLADVVALAPVRGDDPPQLLRIAGGLLGRPHRPRHLLAPGEAGDDVAGDVEGVLVVGGEMVGHAADPRVDLGAAQLLGRHLLAGGRLHQGGAAEENGAPALDDRGLVAHRGHVGAAGGAGAEDHADLRDPGRAQARLVVEDAAEVLAVRKDLGLQGQEGPAGVDEVDAGQPVLPRNLLGPQVLLHGEGKVGPALHAGIVGDHHHLAAADAPDAGDEARRGRGPIVHAVGGEGPDLQEGRATVEQALDAIAHRHLAVFALPPLGFFAASGEGRGEVGRQLRLERVHVREVGPELGRGGVDLALDHRHGVRRSMPRAQEPLDR